MGSDLRDCRILVVAGSFPTPSETFVVDHVRGLVACGASVTIAAQTINVESLSAVQERYGIRVATIPITPGTGRWLPKFRQVLGVVNVGVRNLDLWLTSPTVRHAAVLAAGIRKVMTQVKPDLIHAHFGPIGVAVALARKGAPIPIVVDFHGSDATVVPQASGWSTYRPLAQPRTTLVAHSRFVVGRMAQLGLPVEWIQVGYGYDPAVFYPSNRSPGAWPKLVRLIQVARLVPQKGQRVALDALYLLRGRGLPARLCLVGAGPDAEALIQKARDLELSGLVEFVGAATPDEVAARMRDSDVLLSPSLVSSDGGEEGFGRVVVEGIACGIPAVVFPTGNLSETVNGGGTVCRGTTASDLADGIVATIEADSPQSWKERCEAASAGRALDALWVDYERIVRTALGITG